MLAMLQRMGQDDHNRASQRAHGIPMLERRTPSHPSIEMCAPLCCILSRHATKRLEEEISSELAADVQKHSREVGRCTEREQDTERGSPVCEVAFERTL